ncbi:MAG TPA: hypothetical protein VK020_04380 [Microlunatus sp.]|nr:hypothetical protein [Microlunatus sp.]
MSRIPHRGLGGYLDGGAQLRDHVFRRTEAELERWHRVNDRLTTPERVRERQQEIRAAAAERLGPRPESAPPPAELRGTLARPGYRIEKLIIEAAPGQGITANLYLPAVRPARTGAVLIVCGHAAEGKAYPPYQALAARIARSGLVALIIDAFGMGERLQYPDRPECARPTADHTESGVRCWWSGRSAGRHFVRDGHRALDYLAGRPEVDPERIGVTGNSGGGLQTWFLMLLDERIAAAAPATFLTSRGHYLRTGQAQDAEQVILGGTVAGLDHEDALIAMAPRPVLVLAADYDFFPLEGTLASVDRATRAYRVLGAADRLSLRRTRAGHEYHPELAHAATEFFVRELHPEPGPVEASEPEPVVPTELACTETGQLITDGRLPATIPDLNRAEDEALPAVPTEAGLAWLSGRVEAGREPAPEFHPRWFPADDHDLDGVPVTVRNAYWWSERDLINAAVLIRPRGGAAATGLTVALLPDGTAGLDRESERIAARVRDGGAVLVLDVRGSGMLAPHSVGARFPDPGSGTEYRLTCDLLWLDDSLAAGRVWDVLRCLELIRTDPESARDLTPGADRQVDLWAVGSAALVGALTAALRPDLARLRLDRPETDPGRLGWRSLLPGLTTALDLPRLIDQLRRGES